MGLLRQHIPLVKCLFIAVLIGVTAAVPAQDANEAPFEQPGGALPSIPEDGERPGILSRVLEEAGSLPRGFGEIRFGMSRQEVGTLLMEDPNFDYRGDPDVQFLPRREEVVIDTAGFDFVSRGYFQFHEGSLYSIIINLDTSQVDYFSMFSRLREQYGHPSSLSPAGAIWEEGDVRLALERPLSVKYLDLGVFGDISSQRQERESDRARALRNFLEQF